MGGNVGKVKKAEVEYKKLKDAKITEEWNQVKNARVWHEEPKVGVEKGKTADWDHIREVQKWQVKMRKIDFSRALSLSELEKILNMIEFRVDESNPHYKKLEKYLEL